MRGILKNLGFHGVAVIRITENDESKPEVAEAQREHLLSTCSCASDSVVDEIADEVGETNSRARTLE